MIESVIRVTAGALLAAYAPLALAYVGPGAGLGVLAALFAIVLAVVATVVGLVLWPLRKFLQIRKAKADAQSKSTAE